MGGVRRVVGEMGPLWMVGPMAGAGKAAVADFTVAPDAEKVGTRAAASRRPKSRKGYLG